LIAADGRPCSTSELAQWAWPLQPWCPYYSMAIRRAAAEICDRVGVGKRRAILWVLKDTAATF